MAIHRQHNDVGLTDENLIEQKVIESLYFLHTFTSLMEDHWFCLQKVLILEISLLITFESCIKSF